MTLLLKKECYNCKHKIKKMTDEPCKSCDPWNMSNWEEENK